jgi:hypothetical protein
MPASQPSSSSQSSASSTLIEFPFRLRSELTEFAVADDLFVRHMDDETKTRLLRIEDAKYNESGKLISFTSLPDCLFSDSIGPEIDEIDEFCSSNYVLIAPSLERAKEFDFALKLAGNSSSALYVGFKTATLARYFLNPPCYFGDIALGVEKADAQRLTTLIEQIERARIDEKLQTMIEIYKHALARQRRKESRFIEIAVILEMLLLPRTTVELSYRFSLRLAKLMNKLTGESIREVFKHAHHIYKTRSHLVHGESDSHVDSISPVAYNYVRILLATYLEDRTHFQEANLDEMCLI